MISLTKMLTGRATVSERITYRNDRSYIPTPLRELRRNLSPVTIINVTGRCNLRCVHCYANAGNPAKGELTTEELKRLIDELAELRIPVLLFSGGEPLMREDIFVLGEYATKKGIKCSLSTNGTLIDEEVAEKLRSAGFVYVGVSLDGLRETNDRFRGVKGAFERALNGLTNAKSAGIMTGVRFTVTKYNLHEVDDAISIVAEKEIPRFCLYHLVPSGRADFSIDISLSERRRLIDYLSSISVKLVDEGYNTEILTVDNPADGIYVYLKVKERDPEMAEKILEFVSLRGGDGSGERVANIDMYGYVHPNQFWWDYSCGNIRLQPFRTIWLEPKDELLIKLRRKEEYLRGKCGICRYKKVCGGFRVRALRAGDLWGDDPDCYLTTEEVRA
jgi:radical SAM protein with 4Fe4S-binding SPASM domain